MYSKHGLLHRDIKDENLIVNMNTGEVKLVDFGATAYAEKATKKEFQGLSLVSCSNYKIKAIFQALGHTALQNGSVINFIFHSKPHPGLSEFYSSSF